MKTSLAIVALLLSASISLEQDARAEAQSRPRARVALEGSTTSHLVIAPDGDVIVTGPITGAKVIGSKTLESKVKGVWIARFSASGTVKWASLIDRGTSTTQQYTSSLSVAADGRIRVAVTQDEAPYLRRVTISADGATQTVDALAAETKTLGTSLFPDGDVLASQEPGAKDKCKGVMIRRLAPGGKRVWSTCADKLESSAGQRSSTLADGRSATCANEWIVGFSAKGKRAWEAKHPDERWCQSIVLLPTGEAAAVFDEGPTMTLSLWKNGKRAWTKKCTELQAGSGSCLLDALAVRGNDLVVSAKNGDKTLVAVLDKTGAVKTTYPIGAAAIKAVAAADSTIAYTTASQTGSTIETLER